MSKIEKPRQFDENTDLKVVWRAFDDVDASLLRYELRNAIARVEHRVRLDCREVDGAPLELIEILHEANEFAKCSGKQVTLAFATDHLRQALSHASGRQTPTLASIRGPGSVSASMAAESSLNQRTASWQNPVEPKKPVAAMAIPALPTSQIAKIRQFLQRRAGMLLAIVLGTAVVAGIEWYLLSSDSASLVVDDFEPQIKSFEGGATVSP